jgi:phage shock protein PspC (stress-responsive transcriptional regulator)
MEQIMKYEKEYTVNKPMTKDLVYKKLTGVCAGVAKHYGLPRWGVRIAAIVSLFTFPVATGVAYVVATLLMGTSRSY